MTWCRWRQRAADFMLGKIPAANSEGGMHVGAWRFRSAVWAAVVLSSLTACVRPGVTDTAVSAAPILWRWDPQSLGDRLDDGTREQLQREVSARLASRGWREVGRDDSAQVFVAATIEPPAFPVLTVRPPRAQWVLVNGEIGWMAWRSGGDGYGGCMSTFCTSVGGTTVLQQGQNAFIPVNPSNTPQRGPSAPSDETIEVPPAVSVDTIPARFYVIEGRVAVGMRRRTDATFSRTIGRSKVRVATYRFWGDAATARDTAWTELWLTRATDEATLGLVPPTRVLYEDINDRP